MEIEGIIGDVLLFDKIHKNNIEARWSACKASFCRRWGLGHCSSAKWMNTCGGLNISVQIHFRTLWMMPFAASIQYDVLWSIYCKHTVNNRSVWILVAIIDLTVAAHLYELQCTMFCGICLLCVHGCVADVMFQKWLFFYYGEKT